MDVDIIQKFRCSICKTEYQQPEAAMMCESRHTIPADVKVVYQANGQYPRYVKVTFRDGRVQVYDPVTPGGGFYG